MTILQPKRLPIRVVSDVICPWCFIGKRRMEKALARLDSSLSAQVTWSAFELNPDMPAEGMPRPAYRSAKFGSQARAQELDLQVASVGRSEGIEFNFARIERTPNTFLAHRLIWFARQRDAQDAVVEALFRAYFCDGEDIGRLEHLGAIAARCGIDEQTARDFLQSDEGAAEVARESALVRESGISGVPTFIVRDTYAISGAQSPEVLHAAFVGAAEESTANAAR